MNQDNMMPTRLFCSLERVLKTFQSASSTYNLLLHSRHVFGTTLAWYIPSQCGK
jgi:hypothetical protein